MMTTKGFESSCFGVEDIRLRKVWGGKQLIFVTYVMEECYYQKKKSMLIFHLYKKLTYLYKS